MTQDGRLTLALAPFAEADILTADLDPLDLPESDYALQVPQGHGDFLGLYAQVIGGHPRATYRPDPSMGLGPSASMYALGQAMAAGIQAGLVSASVFSHTAANALEALVPAVQSVKDRIEDLTQFWLDLSGQEDPRKPPPPPRPTLPRKAAKIRRPPAPPVYRVREYHRLKR